MFELFALRGSWEQKTSSNCPHTQGARPCPCALAPLQPHTLMPWDGIVLAGSGDTSISSHPCTLGVGIVLAGGGTLYVVSELVSTF